MLVEKDDLPLENDSEAATRCHHVYRLVLEKVTSGAYNGIWLTTNVHQLGCFV